MAQPPPLWPPHSPGCSIPTPPRLFASSPYPYTQVSKTADGPAPAIVVPHGGPHTALAANFYTPFSLLTALGYCVVAVNYRGSLGFGEDGVQSLPGHIGQYDVEDCMAALDAAVAAGVQVVRWRYRGNTCVRQYCQVVNQQQLVRELGTGGTLAVNGVYRGGTGAVHVWW